MQVGRQEFEAAEYFAHPNWVSALIRNDIGLIRLPQKVEFNEFIRPICLPSYSDVDDNFAGLDVSFNITNKIMYNVHITKFLCGFTLILYILLMNYPKNLY